VGLESHTREAKEMSAKRGKKKSKQKDLYEVTVVDLREANAEQIDLPKEAERPEELKQPEQLEPPKQVEPPEQPKQEIAFKLGAIVALFRPNTGVDKLGRVLKIANQLLTVKWDDGTIEQFSRTGQSFYGTINSLGEPIQPLGDDQKMWGTDEDPHLTLPTDQAK
jgi:hypothetical protein